MEIQFGATGVIFFMTYRATNGLTGNRIKYLHDKPTTLDYFHWLNDTIRDVERELWSDAIITSHSVTGELNQK